MLEIEAEPGGPSVGEQKFLELLDLSLKKEEVEKKIDDFVKANDISDVKLRYEATKDERLVKLLGEKKDLHEQMVAAIGLVGSKFEEKLSIEQQVSRIEAFFDRLDKYRQYKLDGQSAFRDFKYQTINRVLWEKGSRAKELAEAAKERMNYVRARQPEPEPKDPIQLLFYTNMTFSEDAIADLFTGDEELLAELKYADFATSPLTPNFSFELLTNDGDASTDEEESGLASRTFVGPLTFVLNTNGSSLRPTDILNENSCLTSTCSVPDKIDQGLPPGDIKFSFGISSRGEIIDDPDIVDLGDSVNSYYENSAYYGYLKDHFERTVDELIGMKYQLDQNYIRKMEINSQLLNYTTTLGLKYVSLSDELKKEDPRSGINTTDIKCATDRPIADLDGCFTPVEADSNDTVISIESFMAQLNEREYRDGFYEGLFNSEGGSSYNVTMYWGDDTSYRNRGKNPITKADLFELMAHGVESEKYPPIEKLDRFYHRMCFVLAQNAFTDEYLQKSTSALEKLGNFGRKLITKGRYLDKNDDALYNLEELCHNMVEMMFNNEVFPGYEQLDLKVYPPVVIERKLRVRDTTKRYIYKGGKSLNVNVGTSFTVNHSNRFGLGAKINANPVKAGTSIISMFTKKFSGAFSFLTGGSQVSANRGNQAANAAAASGGGGATGVLGVSGDYGYSKGQDVSRGDGTSVSTQTFLAGQQASFDIEVGEFERCMVVRLSPVIRDIFLKQNAKFAKWGFDPEKHMVKEGILICSGKKERKCEPVKEKYFYFTQHFTEGDMLDTADLHNHPWLLQLRGYRDFQTFIKMIDAREHDYIDPGYLEAFWRRTKNDIWAAKNYVTAQEDGHFGEELEVVNKEDDAAWPLRELGRVYFNLLPTFPGLYSYVERPSEIEDPYEWPDFNSSPAKSFEGCAVE